MSCRIENHIEVLANRICGSLRSPVLLNQELHTLNTKIKVEVYPKNMYITLHSAYFQHLQYAVCFFCCTYRIIAIFHLASGLTPAGVGVPMQRRSVMWDFAQMIDVLRKTSPRQIRRVTSFRK